MIFFFYLALPDFFSPFQILTKDSVTVHVDAIMYYKVTSEAAFWVLKTL